MKKTHQNFREISKEKRETLSTLIFIEDLCYEIAKIVPKSQLYGGTISYSKVSKFLGQGKLFLKHIKSRITNPNDPGYNPDYKFSLERLQYFEANLKAYFGDAVQDCLNLIRKYKNTNDNLKVYVRQQWHLSNPKLRADFFSKIDTKEKAYWFGFMCADGSLLYENNKKNKRIRYQIGIEISKHDRDHLSKFCSTIGLELNNMKERERQFLYKDELKKYKVVYIQFSCKPMAHDLLNHNFASSKAKRKNLPKLENRKLMLAWLLGYYDGDGVQRRTDIYSANCEFLEEIRNFFDIPFDIRKDHNNQNV